MTKYFKATFSDGYVVTRSTVSRDYTHAWRIGKAAGFASRLDLAEKASQCGYYAADAVREVAPCVEITRGDYRMHNQATRDKSGRAARDAKITPAA